MCRHCPHRCHIGSRGLGSSGEWSSGGDEGDSVSIVGTGDGVRSFGNGTDSVHRVECVSDVDDVGDGVTSVVVGDRVRSLGHGDGRAHSVSPGVRPDVFEQFVTIGGGDVFSNGSGDSVDLRALLHLLCLCHGDK